MTVAHTDKRAINRAEQLIKQALRVLMQGTAISPADQESTPFRAEIGVRCIAGILWDLSEEYELDVDLNAILWAVTNGAEPRLPAWLRREWQRVHDVRTYIRR